MLARFFAFAAAFFFVLFTFCLALFAFFCARMGPLLSFFATPARFFLPAAAPCFAFAGRALAAFFVPAPARFFERPPVPEAGFF